MMLGKSDLFSTVGADIVNVVEKRLSRVAEEKEWENTIEHSIKFFNAKMTTKIKSLSERDKSRKEQINRKESGHEIEIRQSRTKYLGLN